MRPQRWKRKHWDAIVAKATAMNTSAMAIIRFATLTAIGELTEEEQLRGLPMVKLEQPEAAE